MYLADSHWKSPMKTITTEQCIEVMGRNLELAKSKAAKGYYVEILSVIVDQMDAMLSHHRKVLLFRIDLRMHRHTDCNRDISKFLDRVRKKFGRMKLKRVGYVWCRERNTSARQHYHLVMMVNGSYFQTTHKLVPVLRRHWEAYEIGSLWVPKSPYYRLSRGDDKAYQGAFSRSAYLAKVATKGERRPSTNDYSASRLSKRAC